MSRAFVKDDASDAPPIVPPRAQLPAGVPNYVTPRGLALLRDERVALETERSRLNVGDKEDTEAQRELEVVVGRLAALVERLAEAKLVDPKEQAPDTIRFGATVVLETEAGKERKIQIVGVDEASVAKGRVAFVAPIARAVIGKQVGETGMVRTPSGEEPLTIASIVYDAE